MTPPVGYGMSTAIYVRVSTDKQHTENQLATLRTVAPHAVVYSEQESAVKRRPVLESLLADVRAGKVKVLHVWALDRLHRSMKACVDTVLELDSLGCRVVSHREPWLDTTGPVRSLLVAVFGWVAEQERAQLVERTRAGLARARRAGKRLGRPPEIDAATLRRACEAMQAGASQREAARTVGVSESTLRGALARAL